MRTRVFRRASLLAIAIAVAGFLACGDDDNVVRTRPDGGATDGSVETGPLTDGGSGTLACGVPIPSTYDSPNFAVNAKASLDLKAAFAALEDKMKSTENASSATVTAGELSALFTSGTPSLRSAATASAQTTVDGYITAYADAVGKTWSPADAEDGGVDAGASGGKYDGTYHFSSVGLDLREAIAKTLLGGSFYNYALLLANGLVTEATVDNLLALFGASTKLLNSTDPDAGADADELVAEYAARRDSKDPTRPGPYQKVKRALLSAKAAAGAGDKCKADLDAALKIFFAEWERASYLTAIYYLNAAATNASAVPPKGPAALHGFGEALGFIDSFRGIPQDRRKITDAQIDALLTKVGAATPYRLITDTNGRIVAFNGAFQDIGAIYGLSQLDIEDAKKSY